MNYLKLFLFLIVILWCKDSFAANDMETESLPLTDHKRPPLSVSVMEKQFSKIPLKNFNISYATVDQQTHLIPDEKQLIKHVMERTFRERVKTTVNIQALNEKIMMFQLLSASFSKNSVFKIIDNDFQQSLNTLIDIKEEFRPWIDPSLMEVHTKTLYGCMILLSREHKNLCDLHITLDALLFSLNNPYAFMTADQIAQSFGFNEGDSALCPVVLF